MNRRSSSGPSKRKPSTTTQQTLSKYFVSLPKQQPDPHSTAVSAVNQNQNAIQNINPKKLTIERLKEKLFQPQKGSLTQKRSLEEFKLDSDDNHEIESEEFLHVETSQSDLKVIEPPKKKQKCNTMKTSQNPLTNTTNTTNTTNDSHVSNEEDESEKKRCSQRNDNISEDDERVIEQLMFKHCESVEQQNIHSLSCSNNFNSKIEMKLKSLKRDEKRHQRFVQKLADVQKDESEEAKDRDFSQCGLEKEDDDRETEDVESGEDIDELGSTQCPQKRSKKSKENSNSSALSKLKSSSNNTSSTAQKGKKEKIKYTPLELQYLEMKKKCPDAILFVEAGYRYRFFGEDAEIASRLLGIYASWQHNFLTASIPVYRLAIHARKLVQAGYKVGVVSQMETAALKAASTTKSGPFRRELTDLYTKATLTGNLMDPLASDESSYSNYLMCIVEEREKVVTRNKENVNVDESSLKNVLRSEGPILIGMVAVQSTTGDIIFDAFQDNPLRDELDTRLQHIQPVELILPKELSPQTEKLLRNYTRTKHKEESVRVERLDDDKFDPQNCLELLNDLLESMSTKQNTSSLSTLTTEVHRDDERNHEIDGSESDDRVVDSLRHIMSTQPLALKVCLGALLAYLKDFGLDILFKLDCNFRPFVNRNHMKLDGNTLNNLELLRNQSNAQERGSLLWILDHTHTPFGKRLLINWIKQPLIDPAHIEARLSAIDELRVQRTECLNRMIRILPLLPDLERGITRIFYRKCSVAEFVAVLKGYKLIAENMPTKEEITQIQSPLLRALFTECPNVNEDVHYFLSAIDENVLNVQSLNKTSEKTTLLLNPDFFPKIKEAKQKIAEIEQTLRNHLTEIRKILRDGTCNYVTKTGTEYLIEVKKTHADRVPEDWILMGGTKLLNRYHTPLVREQTTLLAQWRERLQIETENAWTSFLGTFTEKYMKFNTVMRKVAVLDCLESLAAVARQQGYVRPTIATEQQQIIIEEGRHPIVEALIEETFVPNGIHFSDPGMKVVILTGPNMGGKSCFARQVALIVIMAQIGSFVPATKAILSPLDAIFTRMGASENMNRGASTFFVEVQETNRILQQATERSLVILDELGRGTSTHDGVAIAYAVLWYLIEVKRSYTIFITHYPLLAQFETRYPTIAANFHMAFVEASADQLSTNKTDDTLEFLPRVTFLHTIRRGVQHNSYGLNVAMLANIPMEIIKRAWHISRQLQEQTQRKQQIRNFRLLYDTLRKFETSPAEFENNEELRVKMLELIQRIK